MDFDHTRSVITFCMWKELEELKSFVFEEISWISEASLLDSFTP